MQVPEHLPHDARAVANLMLDRAAGLRLPLSHIALQKLLFFAHGRYRLARGCPLVSGLFEAWQFGPVHPLVYQAFKACGAATIGAFRATSFDYRAGEPRPLAVLGDPDAEEHIESVLVTMGRMPIGRLVELSHAPRGPWAEAVNKSGTGEVLGLQISDRLLVERFRFHWVSLQQNAPLGEPREDTPFAGHGPRPDRAAQS